LEIKIQDFKKLSEQFEMEAKAASEKRKLNGRIKRNELINKQEIDNRNKSADSSGSGKNLSRIITHNSNIDNLTNTNDFKLYNKLHELKEAFKKQTELEIEEEMNKKMGIKKKEPDVKELKRQREILEMEIKNKEINEKLMKNYFEFTDKDYHYFYVINIKN